VHLNWTFLYQDHFQILIRNNFIVVIIPKIITLISIVKYIVLKHVTYTSRILLTYTFFIRVVIIIIIIMISSNSINKLKGIFYDICYVKCNMFI